MVELSQWRCLRQPRLALFSRRCTWFRCCAARAARHRVRKGQKPGPIVTARYRDRLRTPRWRPGRRRWRPYRHAISRRAWSSKWQTDRRGGQAAVLSARDLGSQHCLASGAAAM